MSSRVSTVTPYLHSPYSKFNVKYTQALYTWILSFVETELECTLFRLSLSGKKVSSTIRDANELEVKYMSKKLRLRDCTLRKAKIKSTTRNVETELECTLRKAESMSKSKTA